VPKSIRRRDNEYGNDVMRNQHAKGASMENKRDE
jgi:hypothetical protein